jgi:hypothetical protein
MLTDKNEGAVIILDNVGMHVFGEYGNFKR